MALYTGRLLMRGGNESDFDPDKMIPREWGVSTDKGIVRICIKPGVCIRMATYEAFEEDMAKIEEILKTCQSIQEAVIRINTEVSQNADAVAEYTAQAKNYRDEAKTSADNAKISETNSKTSETNAKASEINAKVSEENAQAVFESLPEDYGTLSKEFYEVAIKQKASGEDIHVTDSTNAKVREFALFGKARQQTTSGNQLANLPDVESLLNSGITWSCKNGVVTAVGTATEDAFSSYINLHYDMPIVAGDYFISGTKDSVNARVVVTKANGTTEVIDNNSFTLDGTETRARIYCYIVKDKTVNTTVYPMLNKGTTALPWEQFSGGQPSPSPEFPQEIEVPSGDVVVKSCGKNLLKNNAVSKTLSEVVFTVNNDKSVSIKGTASSNASFVLYEAVGDASEFNGKYISGCNEGSSSTYFLRISDTKVASANNYSSDKKIENLTNTGLVQVYINVLKGAIIDTTIYPMISLEGGEYEPYKETLSTIPTTDFAGIPVSIGGNYTDSNGQQWIANEIRKYVDGSGEYVKRVKKVIYDGVNVKFDSKSSSNKTNAFYKDSITTDFKSPSTSNVLANILCSHFKTGTYNNGYSQGVVCVYGYSNLTNIYFSFGLESELTTVELANAWLLENPMTVYYELAEPIRTPLTAEEIAEIEKLSTFYPVTNISNDADCGMEVSYLADSKLYIDNRLAQIEAALVNNI